MNRHWIQERVYASSLLQGLYARRAYRRGRRAQMRGDAVGALRALLHALKHIPADRLRPGHRELVERILQASCYDGSGLRSSAENALRVTFAASDEARDIRAHFARYDLEDRVRIRHARSAGSPHRPGHLVVLKRYDAGTGERGVLYVTYHDGALFLPALYDLPALGERYQIVLEPSTWGYQDPRFLLYLGRDLDVVVQAQSRPDYEYLQALGSNLVPTRLGAGDWINPDGFGTQPQAERTYDVAMVSAWDPLKRHDVLLRAVQEINTRRTRPLKLVLVGAKMHWTRAEVERLVRRRGLSEHVTMLEHIPHAEVCALLADSRVSVLLSKREGANRAIYESWFADTPTVVYRHHRGVNLDHVTPRNGLLADDQELGAALERILSAPETFEPRAWALEHTGCWNATRRLNGMLQELAAARGFPWSTDIVPWTSTGYATEDEAERMAEEYTLLQNWMQ